MIYDYNTRLRQYIARENRLQSVGHTASDRWPTICDLDSAKLLIAHDQELSAEALQFFIDHPLIHTQAFQKLDEFLDAHYSALADRWTLVSRKEYLAQSALALAVLERKTDDIPPKSTACLVH